MKASYFKSVAKIPLLTATEEIELARLIKIGAAPDATDKQVRAGRRAREKFARSNLRLVMKVASFYEKKAGKLEFDDLVQFGNLGLMRAIDKFDSERGYKFSTYAVSWIRQQIQRGIMNQSRTIRLPTNAHDDLTRIKRLVADHKANGEIRQLGEVEIAQELNIPIGRYLEMRRVWFDTWSTDAPIKGRDGDDNATMLECLSTGLSGPTPAIEDEHEERQIAFIALMIDQLPEREKVIMTARYGLDGREPETLTAVGARLGITRERVRQIQVALTDELRALLT